MENTYNELTIKIRELEEKCLDQEKLIKELGDSRNKCEFFVNNAPDIIYQLDADGNIVFVSGAVRAYGYSPDDLTGRNILDIVHPDDKESARYRINERRTGERRTSDLVLRLLTGENESLSFEVRSKTIDDSNTFLLTAEGVYKSDKITHDNFLGTFGIARDITERKNAQDELDRTKEYARNIIDSSPNIIFTIDKHSAIADFNPTAENAFGYKIEDVVGRNIKMLYADENSCELIIKKVAENGHYLGESTNLHKDGTHFRTLLSASQIYAKKGEAYGAVFTSSDITEHTLVKDALLESKGQMQALMDVSPIAISWADTSGNILYCNNKFVRLFGYTLDDIKTSEMWYNLAYPEPEYREHVSRKWHKAVDTAEKTGGEISPFEVRIACKDGSIRYVEVTGAFHLDRALAIFNDVTERKKVDEVLKNERDLAQLYLNIAGVMLLVIGKDQTVRMINKKVVRYSNAKKMK